MTTSVVMCTYNGEKYILEQLESINYQTEQPDEVIIQDDHSSDKTVQIIKDFIKENHLADRWILLVNDENLGWKSNFIDAVKKASNELIFLADQDDIWDKDKIRIMRSICDNDPGIELLVCRNTPFDTMTGKETYVYQPSFGDDDVTSVPFDGAFSETRRQGCTYALRRKLLEFIDGIWNEEWPHDQFFWCLAISRGSLYSYNKPLMRFRRHDGTNTPSNEKTRRNRSKLAQTSADIAVALLDNADRMNLSDKVVKILHISQTINSKRARYISEGNVLGILTLITRLDYYTRFKAWAGDLAVTIGIPLKKT